MQTTTEYLREVKRIAQLPDVDSSLLTTPESEAWTDEGLLLTGTNELWTRLVPDVMSLREDFFRFSKTVPVSTEGARVRIPSRAIGNKLKAVLWVDGDRERPLDFLDIEHGNESGQEGFCLDGAFVVLRGAALASGSLKLVFYARHGKLVAVSRRYSVTAADGDAMTVTLGTTGLATGAYDFTYGQSPYDYVCLDTVLTETGAPGTYDADAFDTTPSTSEYAHHSGETSFVQLPDDIFPILCQRVAVKVLQEVGGSESLAVAERDLVGMERAIGILASPRTDSSPRKVFSKRLFGIR